MTTRCIRSSIRFRNLNLFLKLILRLRLPRSASDHPPPIPNTSSQSLPSSTDLQPSLGESSNGATFSVNHGAIIGGSIAGIVGIIIAIITFVLWRKRRNSDNKLHKVEQFTQYRSTRPNVTIYPFTTLSFRAATPRTHPGPLYTGSASGSSRSGGDTSYSHRLPSALTSFSSLYFTRWAPTTSESSNGVGKAASSVYMSTKSDFPSRTTASCDKSLAEGEEKGRTVKEGRSSQFQR